MAGSRCLVDVVVNVIMCRAARRGPRKGVAVTADACSGPQDVYPVDRFAVGSGASVPAWCTEAAPAAQRRSPVDLEIVIPAYNEAARLPVTLRETVHYLSGQRWRSRVVVVDNGSIDDTAAIAAAVGSVGPVDVTVIGCSRPGKGQAVFRGLLTSRSPFIGFFDADLATPLHTLDETMRLLRRGAAAVIGSRHAPGAHFVRRQPLGRRFGGAAFRAVTRSLVPGVHDTQCGFKFFERRAAHRAVVRCRTGGFAFDVELLAQIQRDGGAIVELPVEWTDHSGSSFRPLRDGVPSFRSVLGLRAATPFPRS
jgi:dolichyl-phosphate beta-glucosyltransferase